MPDSETSNQRPPTPWWVKVIGIAIVVLVALALVVFLVSGGRHGPGIHGGRESMAASTFLGEAADN